MSLTSMALLDLINQLDNDPDRQTELSTGFNLVQAASQAGLVNGSQDIGLVADHVGRLVQDKLLTFRSHAAGVIEPPVIWGERELQSNFDYRPTGQGRVAASNYRQDRIAEEQLQLVSGALAPGDFAVLPSDAQKSLEKYRRNQVVALQEQRPSAVIGASKNLVEATCVAVISVLRLEERFDEKRKLSTLAGEACQLLADHNNAKQLAGSLTIIRSLAAAINGLAEMRNAHGDGHGTVDITEPTMRDATFAYDSSNTIVRYMISGVKAGLTV